MACTLCAFISLVWLREQILHGGGPDWLEQDVPGGQQRVTNGSNYTLHITVSDKESKQ